MIMMVQKFSQGPVLPYKSMISLYNLSKIAEAIILKNYRSK